MKYIVYCRKSRDEADKQVLSIEAQLAELHEFAKREKLEITEVIEEAKTSKVPGREKFAEVLKKIEKGVASGILAWHPDRLARNSIDGGRIVYLLDTGKLLDLKFPTFWFDNTPQGKFMLSIAFGQSKYYVDNLSENVRRGMRQKLRNGVWPGKATYGYLNNPKTRGIDVDSEKSRAIRRGFELFAGGDRTFTDISLYLHKFGLSRKNGKPLHINEVRQILSNKFYIGILHYNGEYHDGSHKTFISRELFQAANEELKRRSRSFSKSYRFPFLGLARCSECGAAVTAEQHTKFYKTTNRQVTYVYYRCTKKLGKCSQRPVTAAVLEEQLRRIIADSKLPQSWAEQWRKYLEADEIAEREQAQANIEKLKTEKGNLDKKLSLLLDSYLEQVIDAETYKLKKNEIFETKLQIEDQIGKITNNGSAWLEPMKEFIETALNCGKIARAKNNGEDLAIFAKRVGSNFTIQNQRLSFSPKTGFQQLRAPAIARNCDSAHVKNSLMVGLAGLEPATSSLSVTRSNQLSYKPIKQIVLYQKIA